jgi:hypothetical protein
MRCYNILISFTFPKSHDFLDARTCSDITDHSFVADNAGDAVLLHVPSSSERQESGNEIRPGKKRPQLQPLV